MAFSSETAARLAEALSHGVRELSGGGDYREPEAYFAPDELRPTDPGYFDAFDRINDAFTEWLEPGEVGPPDPRQVRLSCASSGSAGVSPASGGQARRLRSQPDSPALGDQPAPQRTTAPPPPLR